MESTSARTPGKCFNVLKCHFRALNVTFLVPFVVRSDIVSSTGTM